MADFPAAPSRWKWFTRLGAIIKGALAHGWIVDDVPGPFAAGEADTMTLNEILELRTTGGGAAFLQALMAMGARFSPVYFNAAYFDADELTVTGLPDVPDDVQWVGVIEWRTTGEHYWFQPAYHITYDPATNRIQVARATFGGVNSQYMAIYVTTQNAYDQVLNAIQIVQLNARQQNYIDTQEVADAENLDFTTAAINVKAETTIGIYGTWTCADQAGAFTLDIFGEAEDTDAGATWYPIYTGDWEYQGTPAATIAQFNSGLRITGAQNTVFEFFIRINVNDINRLRLLFDETAPAAGTLSAQVVIMNR